MIDSHTHLYFPEFHEGIADVINLSVSSGVSHFILPNVDEESLPQMKDFHSRYPAVTSMAIGLHPTEVKEDWGRVMETFHEDLKTGKYVAVGEVGIDLYWSKDFIKEQKIAFEHQIRLAENYKLPVIIHSRQAFNETMEVIEKVKPTVPLIFHSFTGSKADVERIRKGSDPFFGINGVVTYKNANELREAIPEIGLDRIVLETDSPYLTPVPHRGKQNNSSYLCHIRDKVAETLNITPEEVETITDQNCKAIFKI